MSEASRGAASGDPALLHTHYTGRVAAGSAVAPAGIGHSAVWPTGLAGYRGSDRGPLAPIHRSRLPWEVAMITSLLNSQVPEPLFHDAGAERASSASNHPSRNSLPMLGSEFFGRSHNGTCCRIESFAESPVISRGVVGTFGESSGNRHWRYNNHAGIRPELVRILHLLFLLP
jgi:hypothetical protein